LRIIAGKYRSRAIKAAPHEKIRPTADKVKGALFNMLGSLEGCRVVDFFAGTGNLGIEALSRGATEVVFVDRAFDSVKLIRENLVSLGLDTRSPREPIIRVLHMEISKAFYLLQQDHKTFDAVLADPPYEKGVARRVQNLLKTYPLLAPGGLFSIEHESKDIDFDPEFPYALVRQKKYGDTMLSLFHHVPGGKE
jgi:16S rRNA (guanine(966)-N(2))-methyltransferase RsmD